MSVFLGLSGNADSHEQDGETLSGAAKRNLSFSARRSCHGHWTCRFQLRDGPIAAAG
jgi:hypothetical protein